MLKNVLEKTRKSVLVEIADILRIDLPGMKEFDILAAVYFLKIANQQDTCPDNIWDLREKMDSKVAEVIFEYSKVDVTWRNLKRLFHKVDTVVLDDILRNELSKDNFIDGNIDTPDSLVNLLERFLEISPEDSVMNFNVGSGLLLTALYNSNPSNILFGMDVSDFQLKHAYLRATAIPDNKMNLFTDNLLNYLVENKFQNKFDKIISTHPFGLRARMLNRDYPFIEGSYPFVKSGMAADWLYLMSAMNLLKENGKVVAFVSAGCLFTNQDKEARKYFIDNGYIESIVILPRKMYSSIGINIAMVVLSKGNKEIHLVNAESIYKKGRRQNEFTEEHIQKIFDASKNDTEISVTVVNEKFADEDYSLMPERFIVNTEQNIENGKYLGDLVTINRSAMITASELDKLTVIDNREVDTYYLRLSEIHDGVISENLPKISHIDEKQEKLLLMQDDIILSRNGYPFKMALFNMQEKNVKVLPVGNLYVLRADKKQINPVYLKAYLESQQGIANLKGMLTGVAMQVISTERLKQLLVPVPPMEVQNKIAEKYLAIMDEIEVLNLKINAAKDRLMHVIDKEKAGE